MKWLLKPRFSILLLFLFAIVVTMLNTGMIKYCSFRHSVRFSESLHRALSSSPLKKIVIDHLAPSRTDVYKKPYHFTKDVFTRNLPIWEKFFEPYQDKPGLNYLEIGVFEGCSLLWMLENVLTDPNSHATTIDIFGGGYGDYEQTYKNNLELSGASNKVTTIKNFSQITMRTMPFESFDFIYIDGSHAKNDVLEDVVLCWRLVKPGGFIIFDDYRMITEDAPGKISDKRIPKIAIDSFMQCFEDKFDVVHNDYQLIIKRKPTKE